VLISGNFVRARMNRCTVLLSLSIYINIKTPPLYDFDAIFKKFHTCYNESMNAVLI